MRSENSHHPVSRIRLARQDDVVAAAVSVLDEFGFGAASVDRIAEAARTSKGNVLYHFTSKEGIYQAVVDSLYAEGGTFMTERISEVNGFRSSLHVYLDSNLRFIAEHASHVNAVHRILENSAGSVAGFDAVTPLRGLLAAGQQAGEFGDFDPELMALAIRAVIDGASFHFTTRPDLDVDSYIEQVVALFSKATA